MDMISSPEQTLFPKKLVRVVRPGSAQNRLCSSLMALPAEDLDFFHRRSSSGRQVGISEDKILEDLGFNSNKSRQYYSPRPEKGKLNSSLTYQEPCKRSCNELPTPV